jgi:SOS-response transcriptional repressor LexA
MVAHAGETGAGNLLSFPTLRPELRETPIPANLKKTECFTLTVIGDSMESDSREHNLSYGATVLIKKTYRAEEVCRSVCAVRVYGNTECLRYVECNSDGTKTLHANNPDYPPITVADDDIEIVGVMLYEIRKMPPRPPLKKEKRKNRS